MYVTVQVAGPPRFEVSVSSVRPAGPGIDEMRAVTPSVAATVAPAGAKPLFARITRYGSPATSFEVPLSVRARPSHFGLPVRSV